MAYVPEQLKRVAEKVHAGGTPEPVTVRTLLSWFGSQRRGRFVVEWIRSGLAEAGLVTNPDFDSVWIDAEIKLQLAETQSSSATDGSLHNAVTPEPPIETAQALFIGDAYRMRNRIVRSTPTTSLFAAIPEIVKSQYVLVRDPKDKRITGIITGADLSIQFQQLAEPFYLKRSNIRFAVLSKTGLQQQNLRR